MDTLSKMMAFEEGGLSEDEIVKFFVEILNNGVINSLQGTYGRTARYLMDCGLIARNEQGVWIAV